MGKPKQKKSRSHKFEKQLSIKGTFPDVFMVVKANKEGKPYPIEEHCQITTGDISPKKN